MLELGVKFLICYFLGSVMGSMVMGKLAGGVDIRTMGSGNAGGTNALRTQGWMFAVGVVIIDVGKGMVAAGLIPQLALPLVGTDPELSREWLVLSCAAASVIGHVWPMYHGFRGGKGAATLIGTYAVLAPWMLIPLILAWAWVLVLFGYVGFATMFASMFAPLYVFIMRMAEAQSLFLYSLVMGLFIVYSHRSNIRRMLNGEEHRNQRLMIFRRNRD